MNKQELINSIKLARHSYSNEDSFCGGVRTGIGIALGEIEELDEPERVVIPQFVADHIEFCKSKNKRLNVALSESPENEMAFEMGVNLEEANEIYARAWLDGYEIEKEKLYYTVDEKGQTLLYKSQERGILRSNGPKLETVLKEYEHEDSNMYQLTEKEIKDYDWRYWLFAVEVAE